MPSTLGIALSGIQNSQFDPNALTFINVAAIEDTVSRYAINNLVIDLKLYGIWTKLAAIYPFAGSTASSHKWNLKDPRDLDAAYRLTFFGGWTHASTGATPNGTNGYASTFFAPTTNGSQNSIHMSFYSRTNATAGTISEIGSESSGISRYTLLQTKNAAGNFNVFLNDGGSSGVLNTDSRGFYIANRTASSTSNGWKNGSKVYNPNIVSGTNTAILYISAMNRPTRTPNPNSYSSKEAAFASIGSGLTDTEAANFYTIVQRYQTTLSRQV